MKKLQQPGKKHSHFTEKLFSIRTKLIASFLFTVIPIILLGVLSYNSSVASISDTAKKTSIETIKQVNKYLEMSFESVNTISRQITSDQSYSNYLSIVTQETTLESFSYLQDLSNTLANFTYSNKFIQNITMLLRNNKSLSTSGLIFQPQSYENVEDTELIQLVKANMGAPVWVGYHTELDKQLSNSSTSYGMSQLRLARNYVKGEDCGVLIINIKPELITDALKDINLGEDSEVHLISPDKRDIAYVVKENIGEALDATLPENQIIETEFFQTVANKEDDQGTLTTQYKGREHIVLYSRVSDTGYTLIGLVPTANFTASAKAIGNITVICMIFAAAIAIAIGLFMALSMGKTINRIISASQKVIGGDLTIQFSSTRRDELGTLANSQNLMIDHMRTLIKEASDTAAKVGETAKTVAFTAQQVTLVSHEVAKTVQEISCGATAQASDSEQGVMKMKDLALNILGVTDHAKAIKDFSHHTIGLTTEGLSSVEDLESKSKETTEIIHAIMNDAHVLDQNSQTIQNIVKVIHSIADQTNLLSLNAAIEAARAGEMGRGFAVVADEIRKLAEQATSATLEIARIVDGTVKQTSRVVERAEVSKSILNSQNDAVVTVSELFSKINHSMEQLAQQLEEIGTGIVEMDQHKDQTLASIHNISSVSQQIAASTEEVAASTEEQLSSIEELASHARGLEDVAVQLNESIKKFKV